MDRRLQKAEEIAEFLRQNLISAFERQGIVQLITPEEIKAGYFFYPRAFYLLKEPVVWVKDLMAVVIGENNVPVVDFYVFPYFGRVRMEKRGTKFIRNYVSQLPAVLLGIAVARQLDYHLLNGIEIEVHIETFNSFIHLFVGIRRASYSILHLRFFTEDGEAVYEIAEKDADSPFLRFRTTIPMRGKRIDEIIKSIHSTAILSSL